MYVAAITCLHTFSPEELSISHVPLVSFFTTSFAQCSKFVKRLCELDIKSKNGIAFKEEITVLLNKHDLIGRVYFIFGLPGIRHHKEPLQNYSDDEPYDPDCDHDDSSSSSSSSSPRHRRKRKNCSSSSSSSTSSNSINGKLPRDFVYWSDAVGHVLAKNMKFCMAGEPLVIHDNRYLEILDEFTCKPGLSTDEIIGRYDREYKLWRASRRPQERIVRARFPFCENPGKFLPAFLLGNLMTLTLEIAPLQDCFYSSDKTIPHVMNKDRALEDSDIKLKVLADVYHITSAEQSQIFTDSHVHIMPQVQYIEHEFTNDPKMGNKEILVPLKGNFPVFDIWFTLQSLEHQKQKDCHNYSGRHGEDPLQEAQLMIGDKPLGAMASGLFLRTIDALNSNSNKPRKHVYKLTPSFCPEDETFFSGYLNFTALKDKVYLRFRPQKNLGPFTLRVYLKNYNLFRINKKIPGPGWI